MKEEEEVEEEEGAGYAPRCYAEFPHVFDFELYFSNFQMSTVSLIFLAQFRVDRMWTTRRDLSCLFCRDNVYHGGEKERP